MTHYGAISIPRAIRLHATVTKAVDPHEHYEYPPELAALSIGDPTTPTDETVRHLAAQLAKGLNGESDDPIDQHSAMMRYTCALVAFALALRGTGSLPSFRSIDDRTGFTQLHDKDRQDPHKARLVWVPEVARDQLRNYYEHLGRLAPNLGIAARARLSALRNENVTAVPLFWLRDRYRLEPANLLDVLRSARRFGWRGKENAGRHWLRSKMAGKCSAETLSAFLGHWQRGTDPWAQTSSLDPLTYRADLQRCLDPILEAGGWRAIALNRSPSRE